MSSGGPSRKSHPRQAPEGIEEARALFQASGLDLPPIPTEMARHFTRRANWCFSSRPVKRWPYEIRDYVAESAVEHHGDYVLLAHAGHGVNSYALHYYLVQRSLRLFLQVAWGGAYTDMAQATADVNECFRLTGDLYAALEILRPDRFGPDDRLTVVASSFYGGYCILPSQLDRRATPGDYFTTWRKHPPQEFLRQALEWCRAG